MMAKNRVVEVAKGQDVQQPRCLGIAREGITTASQFARFMSGMMTDLIEGTITAQVGNAAVNAGGKLLKVVEMQYKYGKVGPDGSVKSLDLLAPENQAKNG